MTQGMRGTVVLVTLVAVTALAMLLPAAVGFTLREHHAARAFLYSAALLASISAIILLANRSSQSRNLLVSHPFFVLSAAYLVLPPLMALPLTEALDALPLHDAWFEMLSALTTTGASLLGPDVPLSVHLWRAMVGWMGGLLILVFAVAILAPMNMGGFELVQPERQGTRRAQGGARRDALPQGAGRGGASTTGRLAAHVGLILPVYAALTLLLWIGLSIAGNPPVASLIMAMSTLSTSGIVPGPQAAPLSLGSEVLLLVFLLPAVSRGVWPASLRGSSLGLVPGLDWRRGETGLALILILGLLAIFGLQLLLGGMASVDGMQALREFWSVLFNGLSFLTTAGFVSSMTDLAGGMFAGPAGIILMGLAMVGGGIATTAGGLKLMRIFALIWQAKHEVEHLMYPSAIGGDGAWLRSLRGSGAFSAWLFLMVFVFSLAVVMALLAVLGLSMESALIYAVAALSTTGPLVQVVASEPLFWSDLATAQKAVLGLGMMLGRLEFLLLLSVLWPRF